MKRVKVMLMAIAVIALAAGTLAFKARYGIAYCTTTATTTLNGQGQLGYTCTATLNGQPSFCPNLVLSKTAPASVATATVCTTEPTIIDGDLTCQGRICTTATTKLTVE